MRSLGLSNTQELRRGVSFSPIIRPRSSGGNRRSSPAVTLSSVGFLYMGNIFRTRSISPTLAVRMPVRGEAVTSEAWSGKGG